MALPPEQFHVKRRREEEPVETLYIQSGLHQKKRRFTDFIFQRVQLGSNDAAAQGIPASTPSRSGQDRVRSPRSVSTPFFQKRGVARDRAAAGGAAAGGIPTVRATSPGAEVREEQALAAARREQEEAKRQRLTEPIDSTQQQGPVKRKTLDRHASLQKIGATPLFPTSLRTFHISRPSTPVGALRTAAGSGIAKNSGAARARAILVEKLTRSPSLRGASILETLEKANKAAEIDTVVQTQVRQDEEGRPRRRPVVNQAEKKWREQQKDSIHAAKEHLATTTVESADYLDKLAKDLEEVMLDLDAEENQMDFTSTGPAELSQPMASAQSHTAPNQRHAPLKYKPRHPSTRRQQTVETAAVDAEVEDDYVYDTYIRVPVRSALGANGLTDPLADATRKDIGVVVITEEDEDIWEGFLEDEEEENWDGEDVDSNAEDNPANDYPDEELSSADENDDSGAIYQRYRHGGSDEEEFDVRDYEST